MSTYLLTWNPTKHYRWDDLEECIASLKRNSYLDYNWSCGVTKKIVRGDRVFLMRLGDEPRGIVASGKVDRYGPSDEGIRPVKRGSDVYKGTKWEDQSDPDSDHKTTLYVNVRWDTLLNLKHHPIFSLAKLEELNEGRLEEEKQKWTPESGGITIRPEVATRLEVQWEKFLP